ncbi:tumor necrosis factor receptor superfamily member 11B-like [Mizuhopecten yessoensis]|uniref:tumor necrosis factor receptor superfamily member 11B-like n=1 Tax=Mizuhopecten yessoensis TaxID=6573 RepID=UPI000B458871|nr:tumor necrosis factor receptor superfamily member 11B-like [Mizuhopecten yessoensis]
MGKFNTVHTFLLIFLLVPCWSFAVGQTANTYKTKTGMSCILCPPGYYHIKDCEMPGTIAVCRPCPAGTFSNTFNRAIHCAACMPHCESDVLDTVQECNATMDMVCDCPPGKILENPMDKFHAKCKPFIGCELGSGVIDQGTPGHEPVCAKCRPGITFSPEVSWHEPCYPCTRCPNDDVLQGCNTTHDSICNLPRPSWRVIAAIPSIVVNCVFMLAILFIAIVIYIRWIRKKKHELKIDEEECRPLSPVSSNRSSDSGLDKISEQTEMETLGTNWGPIFRMVSRHITGNWKDVIRSLFHAIDVDDCDTIIQEQQNNSLSNTEQIYQCLLKWQQQGRSHSTDILVQILTERSYHELVRKMRADFQSEFTTNPDTT